MLKLHPKVYAALVAVALVALASADNALNGAETWKEAAIQTGSAFFVAAIAYLKSGTPDESSAKIQTHIVANNLALADAIKSAPPQV